MYKIPLSIEGESGRLCGVLIYRYPGRNVPDFGRLLLKLKYTDLTKNTYIRS